ncbi:PF20097 family protein [Clostridium sp. Marseille-Q2269]|uniref:PF20097 family protein n=1 Tax=Clostridium sp. Marseille-Q2269 TaxID=2942205 RepID=UPI002073D923|nr:PF20097 family protein [Clostridium sp. Marseille-Q2269]
MKCPYCTNEMAKGEIEGSGIAPLRWVQNSGHNGILHKMEVNLDRDNIIAEGHNSKLKKTTIQCYKCKVCNKIIIDLK